MILSMVPSLSPLKMVIIKLFIFIKTISWKVSYFRPKYQALTNFSQTPTFHFSYCFFEALPYIKKQKPFIIHDVISCWQNSIKNVVGLICVAQLLSQSQLEILKKEKIKVIIVLDNDETGQKRSKELGIQLKETNIIYKIRHIFSPYDKNCKDVDVYYGNLTIIAHSKKKNTYQKANYRPKNQTLFVDSQILEEIKQTKINLINDNFSSSNK
nr:toprim domain-containing protein [Candidatus Phytoplasma rubi]